jgi:ABC-type nickel/cobalt efflux system permease component RcnA
MCNSHFPRPRVPALSSLFALLTIMGTFTIVAAHPLGNFTISHFARLEVGSDQIKVRYVIDMAEFPTFQELQRISSAANSPSQAELDSYLSHTTAAYAEGLLIQVDQVRLPLTVTRMKLTRLPAAAGSQTMRIECDLSAVLPSGNSTVHRLRFEDRNYDERIGWREIVVSPMPGVAVFDSSAYASAVTDELKSYPADLLAAPLAERSADLSFARGPAPAGARPLLTRKGAPAVARQQNRLAELIQFPELSFGLALLGMLMAMLWGGLHALSPGHGKTVVAAYLVGSRGTVQHAGVLGLTVTITHTAGVLALGVVTLMASEYILPEKLLPPLGVVSGVMVAVVGFSLLKQRLQTVLGIDSATHMHGEPGHSHGPHDNEHEHDQLQAHHHHGDPDHGSAHAHDHSHNHLPPGADGSRITWRSWLALGVSGGILPCPSALVLLLGAISNQRTGFGLLLVLAFSCGLAGVLTVVGVAFVYAGRLLNLSSRFERPAKLLPVFSALVIACAGLVICYGAMNQVGLFG